MTSKAVTKKETTTAVSVPMDSQLSWGSEGIDANDVVIPKLLLMQGLSEFVSSGKARAGDIARSVTGEVLGNSTQGVEIIPFMSFKNWVLEEKAGNRFEYRGIESLTPENVNADLEWTQGGKLWRRNRTLNFYVLLPTDIKREIEALKKLETDGEFPEPKDALLPCVLQFKRTSYGAGKDLATHFIKAAAFKRPPAVSKFKLLSKIEKNDQGTFAVFVVEPVGKSTDEEIATCKKWYEIISNTKVQVDDSDQRKKKEPSTTTDKATPGRASAPIDLDGEDVF